MDDMTLNYQSAGRPLVFSFLLLSRLDTHLRRKHESGACEPHRNKIVHRMSEAHLKNYDKK